MIVYDKNYATTSQVRRYLEEYTKKNIKGLSLLYLRLKVLNKIYGDVEISKDYKICFDRGDLKIYNHNEKYNDYYPLIIQNPISLINIMGYKQLIPIPGITKMIRLVNEYNIPRDPRDLALILSI